jgi:hypothetical protein
MFEDTERELKPVIIPEVSYTPTYENVSQLVNETEAEQAGLLDKSTEVEDVPVDDIENINTKKISRLFNGVEEEEYQKATKPDTLSISKIENENVMQKTISDILQGNSMPKETPIPDEFNELAKSLRMKEGVGSDYSTASIAQQLKEGTYFAGEKPDVLKNVLGAYATFGKSLTMLPKAVAVSVLQAMQSKEGASITDRDWADRYIKDASEDLTKFANEAYMRYGSKGFAGIKISDLAGLPQNIAYSATSMGAGLATGIPIGMVPLPGFRVAAWAAGTAASGAVAYRATTYQIMQQYLELKNEESIAKIGRGITSQEEMRLKEDFDNQAHKYGLWEAVPEAISNLSFVGLLTAPLTKMIGKTIAGQIASKLAGMYGEELLTETITQMGQTGIEAKAGMHEGKPVDWTSPKDWVRAFKEVAPQTFLLTTLMAGAGSTVIEAKNAMKKVKTSLKNEVGANPHLYEALSDKLDAAEKGEINSKILVAPTGGKAEATIPVTEKPAPTKEPKPLKWTKNIDYWYPNDKENIAIHILGQKSDETGKTSYITRFVNENTQETFATTDINIEKAKESFQEFKNYYNQAVGLKAGGKAEATMPVAAPIAEQQIETGRPYTATVYRGSKVGVPPVDEGLYGKGTYYTTNSEYAKTYGEVETSVIKLKNPYVIKTQEEADTFWNGVTRPARNEAIKEGKTSKEINEIAATTARKYLENKGYDGLVARNIIAEGDEVVALYPGKAEGRALVLSKLKPSQILPPLYPGGPTGIMRTEKEIRADAKAAGYYDFISGEVKYPERFAKEEIKEYQRFLKEEVSQDFLAKIPDLKEIGIKERVRPSWRVFQKIGIYDEVFAPAFEAEINTSEDALKFTEDIEKQKALVKNIKDAPKRIFKALEHPQQYKYLLPQEKAVADWFIKYRDDWANKLKLTPEERLDNYVTHIFEKEIEQALKEARPVDPGIVAALDFITPTTIFNPYLQERLGRRAGLREDVFAAFNAYEGRALKSLYYEPLIQRLGTYVKYLPPNSARYLKEFITRITSRPLIVDKEVNQSLKEVGEVISKLPGGQKLATVLTQGNPSGMLSYQATGLLYEAWMGLRPLSGIKNLAQQGLTLAEGGPVAYAQALSLTDTVERRRILSNSLGLKSRESGYLPGIDETFIKQLQSKRRKVTMFMFKLTEGINTSNAFLTGYFEAKNKGLPEETCFQRGDEVVRKTQYLYTKLSASSSSQSSLGRVASAFTTWTINWMELMNDWVQGKPSEVYKEYEKNTGNKITPDNWVLKRKALWTYLVLVTMAGLLQRKTRIRALDYVGWSSLRALADIASGDIAGLKVPGAMAQLTAGLAMGDMKRAKAAWAEIRPDRFVTITRELEDIYNGKKDWMNLFISLEKKTSTKYGVQRTKTERLKRK